MNLMYNSTRNAGKQVTASQAILKGLAEDGGLFVPERIPALDIPLASLAGMSYQETAYVVMKQFLTDYSEEELKDCIRNAKDQLLRPHRFNVTFLIRAALDRDFFRQQHIFPKLFRGHHKNVLRYNINPADCHKYINHDIENTI